LRRVRTRVEVDGTMREMVFLTNNLEWSAATIAKLYRARWQVELLFKELKQTL
jgi:IS4 transposase